MGVPNPPLPRRDDPGDMDTAPLCSIGVSSWSDRGAEAAFDMIASRTPAVTTGGGPPSTRGMRLAASSPPAKRRPSRARSGAAFGHRLRDRRRISPRRGVREHLARALVRRAVPLPSERVFVWRARVTCKLFDRELAT